MNASREFTSFINAFLDNVCPPFLRDWYPFAYLVYRMAYGKNTKKLLQFKERFPFLSEEEIGDYYALQKDVPLKRPTDLNKKSVEFILSHVKGKEILDAACGRGYLAREIAKVPGRIVTGVDIVEPADPSGFTFVAGSITALPFSDGQFDTVISSHALEHIREPKRALNELLRVSKERVIIVLPKQREYRYIADLHVNFFPYLYRLQEFIGDPAAEYRLLGRDWCCIIEKKKKSENTNV